MASPQFVMNTNMHSAFKREVLRLRDGVRRADTSDPIRVAGLQRRYEFFSSTLHAHHQGEDEYLWPVARAKAAPEEIVVLDAMEAEHGALRDALGRLDVDFTDLGPDSDTQVIARHFDDLLTVLDGHCAHEERDGVPIVAKYITPEDMKAFMQFTRSFRHSSLVLPWVCDGATPTEDETTWGMLPVFVRVFVKPMTTRKYHKFSKECGV